jgi:hypothetical protein
MAVMTASTTHAVYNTERLNRRLCLQLGLPHTITTGSSLRDYMHNGYNIDGRTRTVANYHCAKFSCPAPRYISIHNKNIYSENRITPAARQVFSVRGSISLTAGPRTPPPPTLEGTFVAALCIKRDGRQCYRLWHCADQPRAYI